MIQAILRRLTRRMPDKTIGGADRPYLLRWHLVPRNRLFGIYLHCFLRSDDDRALHDHPWWSLSLSLEGRYLEIVPVDQSDPNGPTRTLVRRPGTLVLRRATHAHRIVIYPGMPAWTLFIVGPVVRKWGFWCPQGWRRWQDFTAGEHGEVIGKGCD